MPNVNLYRGGGRSPLGGQVARIPSYAAKPDDIITPKSAWASFGADMVRALTAKAQENRERKDRDVYMAALSRKKEFDPSTMPPPEESNLLAGEREIMAQALLAGEPSLGGNVENVIGPMYNQFEPSISQDPEPEDVSRFFPPSGSDGLFGANGASDPSMQAALIGYEGREDIGTRVGDLQRHEDELKAAEANFVGRDEAMANYAPTTKYGEELKYGFQVDQIERDRVARLKEEERELEAELLRRDYGFRTRQDEIKAGAVLSAAEIEAAATLTAAGAKAAATSTAAGLVATDRKTAAGEVADARVEAALLQTYNNEMAQIREPYQKLGILYPDTLSYEQWKMARNGEASQPGSGGTEIAESNLVTSTGGGENTLPDLAKAAQALIDRRTPPPSEPKATPQFGTSESLQAAQLRTARLEREGIETEKSNREFLDNARAILGGGQRLLRQLENIVPPMMSDDGTPMYKQNPRTGLMELVPNINEEHPGLRNATGLRWGGAFFQNLPELLVSDDNAIQATDAADFIAARNQIGGSAFMQAYDALKGGGHISDAEGEKATAAILNLDANQSEKEFRRTILTLYDEVKKAYTAAEQRQERLNEYYGTRGVQ